MQELAAGACRIGQTIKQSDALCDTSIKNFKAREKIQNQCFNSIVIILGDGNSNDLSHGQSMGLVVVLMVSATLSIVGSTTILCMAIRKHQRHRYQQNTNTSITYHHMVAMLSLMDILLSTSLLFQSLALPRETPNAPLAFGNSKTCATVAFFTLSGANMVAFCNAALALYFLVLVRYQWPHHTIVTRLEIPSYLVATTITMALVIPAAFLQVLSVEPTNNFCLYEQYPLDCHDNPQVDCVGGNDLWLDVLRKSQHALLAFLSLTCFTATTMVYWTVRTQVKRHQKQSLERSFYYQSNNNATHFRLTSCESPPAAEAMAGEMLDRTYTDRGETAENEKDTEVQEQPHNHNPLDPLPSVTFTTPEQSPACAFASTFTARRSSLPKLLVDTTQEARLGQVRTQAIAYSLIYFNAMFWPFLLTVARHLTGGQNYMDHKGSTGFYILQLLGMVCYPSQGVGNVIVYIGPTYRR